MNKSFIAGFALVTMIVGARGQEAEEPFSVGQPLGTVSEAGVAMALSDNVRVFGSFHFAESCTFDPDRNLILAMNAGNGGDGTENDGYVSLINPDGSVHTTKWIGANRNSLTLNHPLGSAIKNGVLYTVDVDFVRSFDLATGQPLRAVHVAGSELLNGIAVTDDGTVFASDTLGPGRLYRVTPDDEISILVEGAPLLRPNGVAIDGDGNVVVVNVDDNAVLTFTPDGELIKTEHSREGGNDGIIITSDGTKYVSSVLYGSVSRIRPGEEAEIIASGIPSAASMCYDSTQNQLVVPMNGHYALAFIRLD